MSAGVGSKNLLLQQVSRECFDDVSFKMSESETENKREREQKRKLASC